MTIAAAFSHTAPRTYGLRRAIHSQGQVEYPRNFLAPMIGAANFLQENSRTEIRLQGLQFAGSTDFWTKREI